MNHLTEEQLTLAYYGDAGPDERRHLDECAWCRESFARLSMLLDALRDEPVPERGDSYGAEVWARIAPRLPMERPRRSWNLWWAAAPAMAALLVVAFLAGHFTQQRPGAAIPARARQRVLLIAMGNHLDRSEILLAELENAAPGDPDFAGERSSARDLLDENRLLRQTAARNGDAAHASVLDELERVLLDVANGPSEISSAELESLQKRIESEGLLFKVRIISSNLHEKGQRL
jgi:hypothetical protein